MASALPTEASALHQPLSSITSLSVALVLLAHVLVCGPTPAALTEATPAIDTVVDSIHHHHHAHHILNGAAKVGDAKLQAVSSSSLADSSSILIFQTSFILSCISVRVIRPPASHEPPVRTLVATPTTKGTYPVILFKHGFLLANCFYTQLFENLASSGYIVVAPQATTIDGDCTDEIDETADVAIWIPNSLAVVLNDAVSDADIIPDLSTLIMAGHSRGGKIAFAVTLGKASKTEELPSFSALVALDPVDGPALDSPVTPQLVTPGCNHTTNQLSIPVLILGTGYGEEGFVPCAPSCCSHQAYFNCTSSPLMYHFSAVEYGHLDFLNDGLIFFSGLVCKSGSGSKALLRNFTDRLTVAFLQATLKGNNEGMDYMLQNWDAEIDSVKLDEPQIYTNENTLVGMSEEYSCEGRPQSAPGLRNVAGFGVGCGWQK